MSDSTRRELELENEVRELKRQLSAQGPRGSGQDLTLPENAANLISPHQTVTVADVGRPEVDISLAGPATSTSPGSGLSRDTAEYDRAPGLTTKPIIDTPQSAPKATVTVPQARSLGDIQLSIAEIEELFTA